MPTLQAMPIKVTRIVTTGGLGFVGSAVVRRLLAMGCEVLALVRPGADPWRLREETRNPALRFESLDMMALLEAAGRERLATVLQSFAPECVLHAAWSGSRGPARDAPEQVDNVTMSLNLLRAAAAAGTRRFVGIGSQAEYGPHAEPVDEMAPTHPSTMYGAAKLACGQLVLAAAGRLDVEGVWVRAFSIYGPGERSGALVPELIQALRRGAPFPLTSCEQRWDYLFEDDAAEALARLVARSAATGVFNLASGHPVKLREAVERIFALVAPERQPDYGALSPGAPLPHLLASTRRIETALGWTPSVSLDEGLGRTVRRLFEES